MLRVIFSLIVRSFLKSLCFYGFHNLMIFQNKTIDLLLLLPFNLSDLFLMANSSFFLLTKTIHSRYWISDFPNLFQNMKNHNSSSSSKRRRGWYDSYMKLITILILVLTLFSSCCGENILMVCTNWIWKLKLANVK
jgi:hypothetical protein